MATPSNPFASSQRVFLDTAQDVSFKMLEGVAKLFELNLQATRAVISETTEKLTSRLEAGGQVTDKQIVAAAQPSAQKVAAYTKHVYDIVTETNADIVAVLQKNALAYSPEFATQLMTAAARNGAPSGNEAFLAAFSNPFGAAQKAWQQAIDTATNAAKNGAAVTRRATVAAA